MTPDEPWAITLYKRYVELYGEPIDQPINPPHDHKDIA